MAGMGSVGLVLGAGGVVGSAFHAGVLAALAAETGWDPRDADLVVGTSAGANTAATLRAGLSAADHLARIDGSELSRDGRRLTERIRTPFAVDGPETPRRRRPAAPGLVAAAVHPRSGLRPVLALAGVLPRGTRSTAALAERARQVHDTPWPSDPTWICAVELRSGRRVVFGRDDAPIDDLGAVVAASSAVPGFFAPVPIGGREYIDGGVHSPTNVDLVAGCGFDAVVVSSPMSAAPGTGARRRLGPSRTWHARTLRRELASLPRTVTTLVVEPTADVLAAVGTDTMDGGRSAAVAESAYAATVAVLHSEPGQRAVQRLEAGR